MSLPSAISTLIANGPADLFANRHWETVSPGFSGAVVFRGTSLVSDSSTASAIGPLALKGWPRRVSMDRVHEVHRYQSSLNGLTFVPRLYPLSGHGQTLGQEGEKAVFQDGRIWDLSDWMPGEPNRELTFPEARRIAAVDSLRQIHERWKTQFGVSEAPCPAVLRRLEMLDEFQRWLPRSNVQTVDPVLTTAMIRVPGLIANVFQKLKPWSNQRVPVHLCFTDIHRDHVLFQNERVAGIIDYGAVKPDSPATDLARLFGDSAETLTAAIADYVGGVPDGLAHALAATAPVCNLAAWILRIARDREAIADRVAVSQRITGWVERLG